MRLYCVKMDPDHANADPRGGAEVPRESVNKRGGKALTHLYPNLHFNMGRSLRLHVGSWLVQISTPTYGQALPLGVLLRSTRNVQSDGNCGFRALALAVRGNENERVHVRQSMTLHLSENAYLFGKLFQTEFDSIFEAVECIDIPVPLSAWIRNG